MEEINQRLDALIVVADYIIALIRGRYSQVSSLPLQVIKGNAEAEDVTKKC